MKKFLFIMVVSIGVVLFTRMGERTDTAVFFQVVRDMGYLDVAETPVETVEFTLPETFSATYEKYNDMLKTSGYDLSLYKGKKCIRYTYLIPSENARANIIVHNGKIIGGDICSITLDGIMLPIKKVEEKH